MPTIRSSTDLRNSYNEISNFCNQHQEPVFITKNGQGDLAVMSIEMFDMLNGKSELYQMLDQGRSAVLEGRTRSLSDVIQSLKSRVANENL